ncbi:ATP-binding cassette domain-containing protein (plasmid) [Cereibacter azotoformans]|uniref:ABC transporter ATP-binding protein n=1 Tax=Cereibacter azotoformans TaxID=43057 RepID=UPI001EEB1F3D|nr:ATP-binding cassette domain-containing protein [Cereibacter azotoformans]ULB12282.1 ATP-binding cassette domain-containing protein [Cereibacter azotoformans]
MRRGLLVEEVEVHGPDGRRLLSVGRLAIPAGQSVAVCGASGAGKTTLLHVLAGLVRPTAGRVVWGGQDLAALSDAGRAAFRRDGIGMIFQDHHLFEELSPLGNAALAAAFAPPATRDALRARAAAWLDRLGIPAADARNVSTFSGGERQRIAVARALAADPRIILADEPTASLDRGAADSLSDALAELVADGGRSLIVVTHDQGLARRMHRVLTLADGRIIGDSDD